VTIALSPAEVVRACDRTFLMLSTPEVCNEVYSMSGGVLEGIANGKSLVDCATLRPEDMQFLEAEVLARGGRFIEAPVSGSKGGYGTSRAGACTSVRPVRALTSVPSHECSARAWDMHRQPP
jgi:3-hydroxyisobutyrate dehydrogenase-like beta-hydroxyacid dehydrogenase